MDQQQEEGISGLSSKDLQKASGLPSVLNPGRLVSGERGTTITPHLCSEEDPSVLGDHVSVRGHLEVPGEIQDAEERDQGAKKGKRGTSFVRESRVPLL